MLDVLRGRDPNLVELPSGAGATLVCPGLQGRIFSHFDGEIVHRVDPEVLRNPSPTDFNNLGGNSLWPAPEGGPFAFNYPPDSDEWLVQPSINTANYEVVALDATQTRIAKSVVLTNRAGASLRVRMSRTVRPMDVSGIAREFALEATGYHSIDAFAPEEAVAPDRALLAPWSLEQFPGADGITAFIMAAQPAKAVNTDFYGDPKGRLLFCDMSVLFRLGGEDRLQIGVPVLAGPRRIGAFDPGRGLLILRATAAREGVYFNIADNAQPGGPFSAADIFSIFNGGALGFFELETIAPMQVNNECISESTLDSETLIMRGSPERLRQYLRATEGIELEA